MPWTEPLDQADPTRISWLVYRTYLRSVKFEKKRTYQAGKELVKLWNGSLYKTVKTEKARIGCDVSSNGKPQLRWHWKRSHRDERQKEIEPACNTKPPGHFSMHPSSLDAASPAQLLLGQTRFAWSRFDPFDWKTWWTTRLSMQSCLIARRLHRRRTTVLGPTHFKGFTFSGTI